MPSPILNMLIQMQKVEVGYDVKENTSTSKIMYSNKTVIIYIVEVIFLNTNMSW